MKTPTYNELLVENQRLRAQIERERAAREEAEVRAEQAEQLVDEEIKETIKDEQQRTRFWVRAWWDILSWTQWAVEGFHALAAKLKHDEKLLSNPNLEPEERLYVQAVEELTVAPKHRDRQGRALVVRKDVIARTGLSESTCYRVAKKLEAANILDAKVYYNQVKNRKDRFEKLAPQVKDAPETLSTKAPKEAPSHPSCHTCESDNTLVSRKTVQTITCRECGTISTTILPERITENPKYRTAEQDPTNPGKLNTFNLKGSIKSGPKASEESSA